MSTKSRDHRPRVARPTLLRRGGIGALALAALGLALVAPTAGNLPNASATTAPTAAPAAADPAPDPYAVGAEGTDGQLWVQTPELAAGREALEGQLIAGAVGLNSPALGSGASCVPGPGADLSRCDLAGADLSRADLRRANLSGATLTGANLTYADLIDANLAGANLSRCNLTDAYATDAFLAGAYLTYANLTGARLAEATLTYANLTGANLTGADLFYANLTGADLTAATLTGADLTGVVSRHIIGVPAALPPGWVLVNGMLKQQ